jgi:ATP-dependent RNA helicase SUPV3L1/SUV3
MPAIGAAAVGCLPDPDFRGISRPNMRAAGADLQLPASVDGAGPRRLAGHGQIARIDRTDGDIDALSKRLAYIRTWTYVAQRKGWVA